MVFGAEKTKPTVVKAGKATITINGDKYLALNVQIQFQRPVEVVPTVGKERVLSIGEPQGTITAEKVLGQDSLKALEDKCEAKNAIIEVSDDCGNGNNPKITCHNVILSGATVTAQGGRGYIAAGVAGTFTALEIA